MFNLFLNNVLPGCTKKIGSAAILKRQQPQQNYFINSEI
jgi:hypothetical protein